MEVARWHSKAMPYFGINGSIKGRGQQLGGNENFVASIFPTNSCGDAYWPWCMKGQSRSSVGSLLNFSLYCKGFMKISWVSLSRDKRLQSGP